MIEQCKYIKFDYKNGVKYSPVNKSLTVLQDYEVKDITNDNSNLALTNLLEYLQNDVMAKNNSATKDYKYFKVVFAEGQEIICTDYESFVNEYDKMFNSNPIDISQMH